MRTLAVIPARLGATRLPRKPLRLLGGAPLIVRVWQRVSDMPGIDRVVVATDSPEIADVVRAAGAEAVVTRADHPSGTDRVCEAVQQPQLRDFEVVVNVQGDEPFVSEQAVHGAATLVRSAAFPLATAAAPADPDALAQPHVVKVVSADDGRAMYFSRAPIPFLRDAADAAVLRGHVRQHIGLYAYARDALRAWVSLPVHPLERIERLEQLRPLAAGMAMGVAVVDAPAPAGVDTEDDLTRANALWTELYAGRT